MTDEERIEEQETDPGYEPDLIDELIDEMNAGVDGITFERDVLETNRPDDWGAIELVGQDDGEWADGRMIDQTLTVDIWVCLSDRGSGVREAVQKVLRSFGNLYAIHWRLVSRNYLYDLDKVIWRWTVNIEQPIAEIPEDDELPFTDPEEDPEEYEDDPEWPETDPEEEDD